MPAITPFENGTPRHHTPVHPQAPDVQEPIRLLEAFRKTDDVTFDSEPLEQFAGEIEQHYRKLAERLEQVSEDALLDDRMYM